MYDFNGSHQTFWNYDKNGNKCIVVGFLYFYDFLEVKRN